MTLDSVACYRALRTRDRRFDGRFYVGVTTTGIYCRPVCPARTPGASRCEFYRHAAQAERAGFRACFRCRPELAPGGAPGIAPMDAMPRLVSRALARIDAGALADVSLAALARELGVSDRHLRRAIGDELGVAPVELAQSRRLALAKQLIVDGTLPITQVAFASGFRSVRRFNDAFLSRFGRAPSAMRRTRGQGAAMSIALGFREPLDWPALLAYLRGHAVPRVEHVDDTSFTRALRVGVHAGWVRITREPRLVRVELSGSLHRAVMPVAALVRRALDLDAVPDVVARELRRDPALARLLRKNGVPRLVGAFDGFEVAVRTVLGQQVSVLAARTLHARLVDRFGAPVETPLPEIDRLHPTAERLATARVEELAAIGLPKARAATICALASAVAAGTVRLDAGADPDETEAALLALTGVGPWTAQYLLMRALGSPDAFPDSDLALLRALPATSRKALVARAEAWRPWRAYAAISLWSSLHGE